MKDFKLRTIGQHAREAQAEEASMVIEYHTLLNIQASLSEKPNPDLSRLTAITLFNERLTNVNNKFDIWYGLKTSNFGICALKTLPLGDAP